MCKLCFAYRNSNYIIGSHLSLIILFRGSTCCSSQGVKPGPKSQYFPRGCFIIIKKPITCATIPQGGVVKSCLERMITNWAEIAKALRDRGLPPSAPTQIKLVKENIKYTGVFFPQEWEKISTFWSVFYRRFTLHPAKVWTSSPLTFM